MGVVWAGLAPCCKKFCKRNTDISGSVSMLIAITMCPFSVNLLANIVKCTTIEVLSCSVGAMAAATGHDHCTF